MFASTCGAPTSTVRQPSPDARMGPIVDPHAMSERTQNSCVGMPRRRATSLPACAGDVDVGFMGDSNPQRAARYVVDCTGPERASEVQSFAK